MYSLYGHETQLPVQNRDTLPASTHLEQRGFVREEWVGIYT